MLVKPQSTSLARIKVVGVGGAGGNAINNMIQNYDIEGVEFIAVNTDAQALSKSLAETKLQIGVENTRGLGSGGNPDTGRKAAEESIDAIHEHLAGADMVFITAGMGGGTGTGASPIIAGVAKNLAALTIAIVEKPFSFEGKRRMEVALQGVEDIQDKVDTLIVIPNQKLFEIEEKNLTFVEALRKVDDVLAQAVKSISQLITQTGLINLDFQDIRTIMANAGTALMGIGEAEGDDRTSVATKAAIQSPLLEFSISGAKGVIFNIAGGQDLGIAEVGEAARVIQEEVSPDCNVVFGASIDEELGDKVKVTVIATGFDAEHVESVLRRPDESFVNTGTQTSNRNMNTPKIGQTVPKAPQPSSGGNRASLYDRAADSYEEEDRDEPVKRPEPQKRSIFDNNIDDDDYETPAFLRNKRKEY